MTRAPGILLLVSLVLLAGVAYPGRSSFAAGDAVRFVAPTPGRVSSVNRDGNCFLVNERGYVLTCNHVVSGSQSVIVRFCGQDTPYGGIVSYTDSTSDLALVELLKFDRRVAKVRSAVFADTAVPIEVGDEVRINPADKDGRCDAGVFGRVLSLRGGDEQINTFSLLNGHSGAALVANSGLVVGSLQASEVTWGGASEEYLLPPYRFVPAARICSFLGEAGVDFQAYHPQPPEGWARRSLRWASVAALAACTFAGAREHVLADDAYSDYRAASGWENGDRVRSLRESVEHHDRASAYWTAAAVAAGGAVMWEYGIPQHLWEQVKRLKP